MNPAIFLRKNNLWYLEDVMLMINKNDIFFVLSLISGLWFALVGMVWVYWIALFIAYPFGLISFLLWRNIRQDGRKRTKIIPVILTIGLALSLSVLIFLLIRN